MNSFFILRELPKIPRELVSLLSFSKYRKQLFCKPGTRLLSFFSISQLQKSSLFIFLDLCSFELHQRPTELICLYAKDYLLLRLLNGFYLSKGAPYNLYSVCLLGIWYFFSLLPPLITDWEFFMFCLYYQKNSKDIIKIYKFFVYLFWNNNCF